MKNLWLLSVALIVGCAGKPHSPNGDLQKARAELELSHPGKFGLLFPLKVKDAYVCQKEGQKIELSLKEDLSGREVKRSTDCKTFPGYAWVRSDAYLSGRYRIELFKKANEDYFKPKPIVRTLFKNTDYDSGSDGKLQGAQDLAKKAKVKDSVDYNGGDRTDWFRIKGKNGYVNIVYKASKNSKAKAQLFKRNKQNGDLQYILKFKNEKKRKLKLRPGSELYVRVRSYRYADKTDYELLREDLTSKKGTKEPTLSVSVIDGFNVSDSESVILLRNQVGLKVGETVEILGRMPGQSKFNEIGNCIVAAAEKSQASCKMDVALKQDFQDFQGRKQ